jgi:hypothetical protein
MFSPGLAPLAQQREPVLEEISPSPSKDGNISALGGRGLVAKPNLHQESIYYHSPDLHNCQTLSKNTAGNLLPKQFR